MSAACGPRRDPDALVEIGLGRARELDSDNPIHVRKQVFAAIVSRLRLDEPSDEPVPAVADALAEALDGLPGDHRVALTLMLHGYDTRTAAELMEWSPRQVRNLVNTALERIDSVLEERGIET